MGRGRRLKNTFLWSKYFLNYSLSVCTTTTFSLAVAFVSQCRYLASFAFHNFYIYFMFSIASKNWTTTYKTRTTYITRNWYCFLEIRDTKMAIFICHWVTHKTHSTQSTHRPMLSPNRNQAIGSQCKSKD